MYFDLRPSQESGRLQVCSQTELHSKSVCVRTRLPKTMMHDIQVDFCSVLLENIMAK